MEAEWCIYASVNWTIIGRLFGTKPLPEPNWLSNNQLDHQERISVKFEKIYKHFHSRKCIWKCHLQNSNHFGLALDVLTHLPLVTHINASMNWVRIGSGNGLSPVRRQAITWTNAGLLPIGLMGTNFSEIQIRIPSFSFKKMHLKLSSAKVASILSRGDELNNEWNLNETCSQHRCRSSSTGTYTLVVSGLFYYDMQISWPVYSSQPITL